MTKWVLHVHIYRCPLSVTVEPIRPVWPIVKHKTSRNTEMSVNVPSRCDISPCHCKSPQGEMQDGVTLTLTDEYNHWQSHRILLLIDIPVEFNSYFLVFYYSLIINLPFYISKWWINIPQLMIWLSIKIVPICCRYPWLFWFVPCLLSLCAICHSWMNNVKWYNARCIQYG